MNENLTLGTTWPPKSKNKKTTNLEWPLGTRGGFGHPLGSMGVADRPSHPLVPKVATPNCLFHKKKKKKKLFCLNF
jgi:hypothetical protein